MTLKGSKTEANLHAAFAGETQKQAMYQAFAQIARREGYEQLAWVFEATAQNEREHAQVWLDELCKPGTTLENLQRAMEGETYEHAEFYPEFARVAREEGFENLARQFELVAAIEQTHAERYEIFLQQMNDGTLFEKPQTRVWVCRNCGMHVVGQGAPAVCEFCKKGKAFFEIYRPMFDDADHAQSLLEADAPYTQTGAADAQAQAQAQPLVQQIQPNQGQQGMGLQ